MGTRSSDFDVYFTSSYLVAQHAPYLQPLDVSNNFLYHRTDLVGRLASDPSWKSAYEKISSQVVGRRLEPKKPGDKHRTHVHALAVAINKFGKNQTAAEKRLAYLATPAAMTTYAKAGGIPAQPAVPSSLTGTNPIFKYVARDLTTDGFSEPSLPRTFDIETALAQDLSGAWTGQQSIDAALKEADSDLAELAETK
ncbi:hypothetical protein [Actinoallomurus acaciae]|uniref:Extracellular solute-binding protein n=1 Tax=Actinoallomurus acaciae TaxID=502577 RepID=A0ABV5YRX9_9ACTN